MKARDEALPKSIEALPKSIAAAKRLAQACERCPLYRDATQTVFGQGPEGALIMFVGEQPGDREDLAGEPFVGPAGRLFDLVLNQAGIDRGRCYITNAVKHFKFEQRGKRRLHQRPNGSEIEACKWWLRLEVQLVRPRLLVALGATAAASITGKKIAVMKQRGDVLASIFDLPVLLTVHPSSLLRIPDRQAKDAAQAAFCQDLRKALDVVPEAA